MQSKIQFLNNIFKEHLNQIRHNVFKKHTFIIMMTDQLPLNTELKRVNNKFASLLLRFLTALKLTSFMQASLYGLRFVVNKGDRSIRCFSWKTSLKKTVFSALASKLNMALLFDRKLSFLFGRKFTYSTSRQRLQTIASDRFLYDL